MTRCGEGGSRQFLGVEAVGGLLGRVGADGEGAFDGFGSGDVSVGER